MYQPPPIPEFLRRSDARKHAQKRNLALGEIDIQPLKTKGYTYSEREATPIQVTPKPQETDMATKKSKTTVAKKSKTTVAKKSAGKPRANTDTVLTVLKMLSTGATKAQLLEALPDTKIGYINGLLHRILREKGYKVVSSKVGGSRSRMYSIAK